MRLLLIGAGSFIAKNVAQAATQAKMDVVLASHDAPLAQFAGQVDAVVNFAISPRLSQEAYAVDNDFDLRAAIVAAAWSVPLVMLSTRRVYGANQRWNAVEASTVYGDETLYGRNKAISEKAVLEASGGRCLILRLSNIFGFEFGMRTQRRNFFATLLRTLYEENTIFFDMHPGTRRDFLPAEDCAAQIVHGVAHGAQGIFNLGSGFAVPCEAIATWVMEGFGSGRLIVTQDDIRDEFFLNMDKWHDFSPFALEQHRLRQAVVALGHRLKHA
jgi:nucleoside-diphosphate-sugar epimerase